MGIIIALFCVTALLFFVSILCRRNEEKTTAARKERDNAIQRKADAEKELREIQTNFINGKELYDWVDKHAEMGDVNSYELLRQMSAELNAQRTQYHIPTED